MGRSSRREWRMRARGGGFREFYTEPLVTISGLVVFVVVELHKYRSLSLPLSHSILLFVILFLLLCFSIYIFFSVAQFRLSNIFQYFFLYSLILHIRPIVVFFFFFFFFSWFIVIPTDRCIDRS